MGGGESEEIEGGSSNVLEATRGMKKISEGKKGCCLKVSLTLLLSQYANQVLYYFPRFNEINAALRFPYNFLHLLCIIIPFFFPVTNNKNKE